MKTPQEIKAEELIDKFSNELTYCSQSELIQCAKIAVEEIINETNPDKGFTYWQEVLNCLNKI